MFAGGWTLEAAEAVGAGEDIEEGEILELLSLLVDKSLVMVAQTNGKEGAPSRYRMLELVRQYARERFEESEDAGRVRKRHARYYLALTEAAEPKLRGPEQLAWLERLEAEHANLRAALSWMLDRRDAEPEERAAMGLRLAAAVWQLWISYGHLNEGREWLERGLSAGARRWRLKTISPVSGLPTITEAVTIDGYSQPGATENTQLAGTNAKLLIQLDGTNASTFAGITIEASNVGVQGLVINDFFEGVALRNGVSNVKIEGNFIGTNPSGTRDQGNLVGGVSIFGGSNNVIGGAPRTAHNLISGNDGNGILIQESNSNAVLGNLIGTRKDGKNALGNTRTGVFILDPAENDVGGRVLGMPNTIAFNGGDGVEVEEEFAPFNTFFDGIFNNSS